MNPYGKSQTRKKTRKAAPIAALALLLTIPLYLSFTGDSSSSHQTFPSRAELHQCDLFSGEWVPNPDGPYYTNETCNAIQEHQNCMRFGRPDTGYLKWRWKPDACELPLFQPDRFLKLVRGKSLAFVGDSVARNHMQSLLCLLSKPKPTKLTSLHHRLSDLSTTAANNSNPRSSNLLRSISATCSSSAYSPHSATPPLPPLASRFVEIGGEGAAELGGGAAVAVVGDDAAFPIPGVEIGAIGDDEVAIEGVAHPIEWSDPLGKQIQYHYKEHDFNISIFWTPFLVKTGILDPSLGRPFDLYLDEFDDTWSNQIAQFHYVIISAGHWFFRPSYFHLQRRLHGCLYCPEPDSNITHLTPAFAHRWAFRTAFRAINGAAGYKGVTFVRTFAPSHFEGGAWDKGGNCLRTKPFTRNETSLDEKALEFYTIQLEELGIARTQNRGRRFVLFDTTKPMVLRPDGHPSIYGHLPGAKLVMSNDCVHWCLPGPIDAWSDFLQELLRREVVGN
ncbi:hypothetical protein SASPL_131177 [Salvia splendens]|uniref:Trichome birefringence-like N-terminal domain-containing protein n=1 Tax=Salvia splendens TaxID=180675 RepID=A0A8X8X7D7_SALSN|nr:hypothetical protein SASPL_131177 [Salvia splendens]